MRNLLVFFVCLAGIYSSYAQQRIDALEFVKNAPWDLTESEIDEKYKENSFELADSLKVSLAASSGGNLNFANKFLDEFCIGKYNGFTLYTINEETRKPDMFFTYIHPEQIANTDETELLRYMDSLLYVRLGEPDHKQDDYSDDNGNFVMRLWAKGTDLTVVITASLMKIVESPETPLMYFVSVAKADDGSNDFRNARWGDSMSQIVEKEGRKNEWTGQILNPNVYSFSSSVANKLCDVLYFFTSDDKLVRAKYYFIFLSVRLNRLKNKLLANYLRNRGNDLATVRNSAFCVAILSNNSFICKYNIFFRKYELSVAILKIGLRKKKIIHPIHEIMLCNK